MPDIYDMLIGPAPDKTSVTADLLRRRRDVGQLGVLTGDEVLGRLGGGMMNQSDDYARQLQTTRQMDVDNAQTKAYQEGQLGHMGNVLKETIRSNNLDYDAKMAELLTRLQIAQERADAKGGRKLTDQGRKNLTDRGNIISQVGGLLDTFQDDYTQILGPGPQSSLPVTLANLTGIGTKGTKEAGQWWADWKRFYTLPERNRMFGATLTPNEMKAWREADINPNLDPAVIRERIRRISNIAKAASARLKQGMGAEGFDAEVLETYLPEEMLGQVEDPGTTTNFEETSPDAAVPEGSATTLTPQQRDRLNLLREKRGFSKR